MTGTGGFQTQAYPQPAAAVAGDFASQNPYFTFDAGPGGLVAGAGGVTIGLFAWVYAPVDPDGTGQIVQNYGNGQVSGFVHREQQGLNPTYLSNAGMTIQPGFGMSLMMGGDFWVVNNGTAAALIGMKAFATLANGQVTFAAAGSIPGGASATGSTITPETNSWTGSISGGILTVTGSVVGTIYPGTTISGTGIAVGTIIQSQITPLLAGEATNGIGRYLLTVGNQSVASEAMTGTYGLLTIGTATGTFVVGDILTGTSVVAGTAITVNVTGTGGSSGTMVVNNNTNVGSTTITASTSVETRWYAVSTGLANELVKISDHFGTLAANL